MNVYYTVMSDVALCFLSSQTQSHASIAKVWPRKLTSFMNNRVFFIFLFVCFCFAVSLERPEVCVWWHTLMGQGDQGMKQYQRNYSHDSLLEAFWLSSCVSPSLSLSISLKETTAGPLRLRVHKDRTRTSGGYGPLFACSIIFIIRSGTAVDLPAVRQILTAECVRPRGWRQTGRWGFLLLWELMIYLQPSTVGLWQVLL